MNLQPFSKLLARHPQLKNHLEQDNFLVGYSTGGQRGELLSVFLLNSPWREYCLQAKALEVVPSGGVLVVSLDNPWQLHGIWQGYYLDVPFVPSSRPSTGFPSSQLTPLATAISLKSAKENMSQKRLYSSSPSR